VARAAGATITMVPRPAEEGRWTVDMVATIHGRSWARPLAFVALPFMRGSLHSEYRRVLDEVAEDVNRAAAAFAHEDTDQPARDCFTPGALAHRFHSVQPPDTGDQWPGHHVT
jgi:hypothetical protein